MRRRSRFHFERDTTTADPDDFVLYRRGNTNNQPTTGEYGVMAHSISRVADGSGSTFSNIGTLHGSIGDITFNTCALRFPPPFFPTTGRWTLAQFFEINPQNFDPTVWFSRP